MLPVHNISIYDIQVSLQVILKENQENFICKL